MNVAGFFVIYRIIGDSTYPIEILKGKIFFINPFICHLGYINVQFAFFNSTFMKTYLKG